MTKIDVIGLSRSLTASQLVTDREWQTNVYSKCREVPRVHEAMRRASPHNPFHNERNSVLKKTSKQDVTLAVRWAMRRAMRRASPQRLS